ncbi:S-layer homology domain-containing protein [Abyssisolibacter fermentans]|uniref:S-layer homology domain-containing protein n=1 Tax=Abyssisolibacter fermentans TaxID=1766203 RepID=UPI00083031F2|nr:S-layer homology domain-containing protein [Abyssisolibacter fermentans]
MLSKHLCKRIVSVILIICMVGLGLPIHAFANINQTKFNSVDENQNILSQLQEINGDISNTSDITEYLTDLGIIDEDGIVETSMINIDGKDFTLQEVKAMLTTDDIDLEKIVSVDGSELTLNNLKTMIEIEDEISRIKNEYFNNDTELTKEHEVTFNSLVNQISTSGIDVQSDTQAVDWISPSGIDHQARVSYEISGPYYANYSSENTATVTFELNRVNEQEVSFSYNIYSGSASSEGYEHHFTVDDRQGSIVFAPGETEKTIDIVINQLTNDPEKYGLSSELSEPIEPYMPNEFWTEDRILYINCNNIENALFENENESMTIPVAIKNQFDLENCYKIAKEIYLLDISKIENGTSFVDTPGKYRDIENELIITSEKPITFEARAMIDTGVFSHINLPIGYFLNENGGNGNIKINISSEYHNGETYERQYEIPIESSENRNDFNLKDTEIYNLGFNSQDGLLNGIIENFDVVFDYSGLEGDVDTYFWDDNDVFIKNQMDFIDKEKPYVKYVKASWDTYDLRENIPITITYSEPVYIDDISINVNGTELLPMESNGTISNNVSFLYEVETYGLESLNVTNIQGARDLSGKMQDEESVDTITVIINEPNVEKAFDTAQVNVNIEGGDNAKGDITVSLSEDDALNDLVVDMLKKAGTVDTDRWLPNIMVKVIGKDGTVQNVNLYADNDDMTITKLKGEFDAPINLSNENKHYIAEFYFDEDITDSEGYKLLYALTAEYVIEPIVFIDDNEDLEIVYKNWPLNNIVYVYENTPEISLNYNVKNNATWQSEDDFQWFSSDVTVASIDKAGNIIFTGNEGQVTFTLKALNGGADGKEFSINSKTLVVKTKQESFLYVPEVVKNIETTLGNNAKVYYATNLTLNNRLFAGEETVTNYCYRLYEAEYESLELQKGKLVQEEILTASDDNDIFSYTIDKNVLNNISLKGRYSYILEISAQDLKTGETLSTSAYIAVRGLPAKANLNKPEKYYIIDDADHFEVSCDIENLIIDDETEFGISVIKNEEDGFVFYTDSLEDIDKNHSISIEKVDNDRLLDMYTVSLKAKNRVEDAFSYDSYVLYVYNSKALKILVNGTKMDSFTMSNGDILSTMTSDEILALNRKINISDTLSINNNDYNWSKIADKFKWESSNDDIASIKYNDGGFYKNIEDYTYSSFDPNSNLLLQGKQSGSTIIKAIHDLTGMEADLDVTVDNLEDKLYLFNVFPRTEANAYYTNGKGVEKQTITNNKGSIAIYEESGIESDVCFSSNYNSSFYSGSIEKKDLISNQNNIFDFGLYPQNNIMMSPFLSKRDIHLVKENGEPYNGDVIIRGGVYRNDKYCPDAKINNIKGYVDQTIHVNNGLLKLNFNANEFIANSYMPPITPKDNIEFIIEVRFKDNNFRPEIIKLSSYNERYIKTLQKIDADRINNNIGIISQTVETNGRVEQVPEIFGINPEDSDPTIITEVLLPKYVDTSWVKYRDNSYGYPHNQYSEGVTYPFSSFVIVKNVFKPSQYVKRVNQDWQGGKRNLSIKFTENTGYYLEIPNALSLVNLTGYGNVENSSAVYSEASKITADIIKASEINIPNIGNIDGILEKTLRKLSRNNIDSSSFSLIVSPTEDPRVYKGILKIAVGEMSHENPTGVYMADKNSSSGKNLMPGLTDLISMQKGEYLKNAREKMNEAKEKMKDGKRNSNTEKTFGGGAYIECEISYNTKAKKWDLSILKSDTFIGIGCAYVTDYNAKVGPVPVTGQFKTGLSGEIGLKTIISKYNEEDIRNYITELRIYLYVKAFGGIGFDYSVLALKIGVFGQVSVDGQFLFLNNKNQKRNGQKITLLGRTGIEFEAKALFVKYEKVIASATFLNKSFKFNSYNYIKNLYPESGNKATGALSYRGVYLEPVSESVTYEDRSYLSTFDRKWSTSMLSRALDDEINIIETNAYPYANPAWTDDGMIMIYLSDMGSTDIDDTAVCFTKNIGDTYPLGKEIDSSDYADTDVKIDGKGDFAAVTWIRCMNSLDKSHGDELTGEDILTMTTGTEIMASIYDGTDFTTTRLTNNSMPDMAPVIATNGEKVLVAWRSLYASDMDNPLDFDGRDKIMYSIYDDGEWSDERCLYDGSTDKIKGINAKMLSDGTSAITYQIQINDTNNTEIACAILNETGEVVNNIRITNNEITDENPQITSVLFPDGVERFIIGWNTVNIQNDIEENGIRLCAINDKAVLYPEFEKQISNAGISNYQSFHFTKGAKSLDDLSIVWKEPYTEVKESEEESYRIDKDIIYGMKFIEDNDDIVESPKIKLIELDDYNVVDFFDCFTNAETKEINLVMQTSDYSNDEVKSIETTDGDIILLPVSKSNLSVAKAGYKNNLIVEGAYFSYDDLIPEMDMPVQFCLFNEGIEPITKVTINLSGDIHVFEEDTLIRPGEYKNFTVFYTVPEKIINPDYSVKAEFLTSNDTKSDKLYMDIPDVGIYRIDITKEMERERSFNVHLYNDTFSKLTLGKHVVKLELFNNPNLDGSPIDSIAISDAKSLEWINDGIFTQKVSLDEETLKTFSDESGEIPEEGFRLYFSTVIEENGCPIREVNIGNNTTYVKLHSLLTKNCEDTSITTVMENETGKSIVKLEVLNNSMNEINNGNIIVNLKDEKGNIIETKQTYNSQAIGKGLIMMGGEERLNKTFNFSKLGVSSDVIFSRVNEDSCLLDELKFSGVYLDFDKDVHEYIVQVSDLIETLITVVPEYPNANITISKNGQLISDLEACNLENGENTFEIFVKTNANDQRYTVIIYKGIDEKLSTPNNRNKDYKFQNDYKIEKNRKVVNGRIELFYNISNIKTKDMNISIPEEHQKITMTIDKESAQNMLAKKGTITIENQGYDLKVPVSNLDLRDNESLTLELSNLDDETYNNVLNMLYSQNFKMNAEPVMIKLYGINNQTQRYIDGFFDYIQLSFSLEDKFLSDAITLLRYDNNSINHIPTGVYGKQSTSLMLQSGIYVLALGDKTFEDITNHWAKDYIENMSSRALLYGKSSTDFCPDDIMTRAEMATLVHRLLALLEKQSEPSFYDVLQGAWYEKYVSSVASYGLMVGYTDNSFGVNNRITRQETMVLIDKVMTFVGLETDLSDEEIETTLSEFDDSEYIPNWAKKSVAMCVKTGIVKGYDNKISPSSTTTRAEIAKMFYILLDLITKQ